jgi:serine/threonine protein kinase
VVQGTPSGAVVPTARRFGRYETIARIATGGMAEVYLARQTGPLNFTKLVVIKTIHPHLAAERELVDMLLDEARIAAQLKHPHIVDIYDLGEEGDTYFIAMEYLAGASLADVLVAGKQGERLGIFSMAALVAEYADALHAAHTWSGLDGRPLGLVHRDVTPANIIVLYTGEVKLVDFGIAKDRGRAVVTGTDHRLKGKIGYVAPEQLDGAEAEPRCDVFALGIVL